MNPYIYFYQSKRGYLIFIFLYFSLLLSHTGSTQSAYIKEETITLKTYPFDDPNPVPIIFKNPKIYPYFKFDRYSLEGKEMPWKVIRLENDYIQVFVLPDAGGKVWGAIEKSTGEEFIYRNEVMKFRDIAMRGPWTSGGIEFNFGIIGHSPSTASPVDYLIRENEDGSVSCIVGNMDLPSRTHWRIEIRLPKDKAYFETRVLWYNPTLLTESYYNWMTASAGVSNDLEFFCPGHLYLEHSGESKIWPIDPEGRKISIYGNNNFGLSKSYHVVGEYNDFFGGYFHEKKFGFGHWAPYEEMPGQKLWLWALSRSGGIWEDLLTDTDGQYIEFQAGRLLNQYSPGTHQNPIRQVGFEPYASDTWKEIWFPFKEIHGMVDVSPYGVMNIENTDNKTTLYINALQKIDDMLEIRANGKKIYSEHIKIDPMEIYSHEFQLETSGEYEVILGNRDLYYSSNKDSIKIKRPFQSNNKLQLSNTQWLYNKGIDAINYREYKDAMNRFQNVLESDATHIGALLAMAELYYRRGEYDKVIIYANHVLEQNTYNPEANYWAGIAYKAKGDEVNALESLGWAARSIKYKSVSYTQMAEIYAKIKDYRHSKSYALKALDFNAYNIPAHQVLILSSRMMNEKAVSLDKITALLKIDPLNHFAGFEKYLLDKDKSLLQKFTSSIHNEFPEETHLELAIYYDKLGLTMDAIDVLTFGPSSPKNNLWLSYLYKNVDPAKSRSYMNEVVLKEPDFVFPYRIESLKIFEWATGIKDSWKLDYYLALNYLAVGRDIEAAEILASCEGNPDNWIFYLVRAELEMDPDFQLKDIRQALELAPEEWRTWNRLIQFYLFYEEFDKALENAEEAFSQYPNNSAIEFNYAKSLLHMGKYEQCIEFLSNMVILPFEESYESRLVYEEAHIRWALNLIEMKDFNGAIRILLNALEWPENLGVGKPYNPDERRQHYLLAYCYQMQNLDAESTDYFKKVVTYTQSSIQQANPDHSLGLLAMKKMGLNDQAKNMMQSIRENAEYDSSVKEWLTAVDKNDMNELSVLSDLYADNQYTVVYRIIRLTN